MLENIGQHSLMSKKDIQEHHLGGGQFNVIQYFLLILAVIRGATWLLSYITKVELSYITKVDTKCH